VTDAPKIAVQEFSLRDKKDIRAIEKNIGLAWQKKLLAGIVSTATFRPLVAYHTLCNIVCLKIYRAPFTNGQVKVLTRCYNSLVFFGIKRYRRV
jgi:hypothetical protein